MSGKMEEGEEAGLPEEVLRQMRCATSYVDMRRALERMRVRLMEAPVKIAVTGRSGAGKSSTINALRNLEDYEDGAAKTGSTECTAEAAEYTYPDMAHLKLVDLPGCGTTNVPEAGYWERYGLGEMDGLLVVTTDRVFATDVRLVQRAQREGVPVFFIRTHADVDHRQEKRRRRRSHPKWSEADSVALLKDDMARKIRNGSTGGDPISRDHLFVIAAQYEFHERFDFPALQEAIRGSLPDLKARQLVMAMHNSTEEWLEYKRDAVERTLIPYYRLLAAANGMNPDVVSSTALDIALFIAYTSSVRNTFGLDDNSLEAAGIDDSDALPPELSATARVLRLSTAANAKKFMVELGATAAGARIAGKVLALIPIIGSMAAAAINYKVMNLACHQYLDRCLGAAREVRTFQLKRASLSLDTGGM